MTVIMEPGQTPKPRAGFWQRLVTEAAELLYLERCRVCRACCHFAGACGPGRRLELKSVCAGCWRKVIRNGPCADWCTLDGHTSFLVASGCRYRGPIKRLVYKLKYDGDRLIAFDLSLLLVSAWARLAEEIAGRSPLLVPVPLHGKRLSRRGYNQAELLARHAGRRLGVVVDARALKRSRATDPQHGLGRCERLANVAGAFTAERRRVEGRFVILVDDICTSGATLSEAARATMSAGAAGVAGLAVARAVLASADDAGDI